MKKSLLYSTAVLSAMALGSCSNDDVLGGGMPETTGANQVIEISVANAGDGMSTRAGRPLFSSEAKQTIENVKIIVCDPSTDAVVADTLITNWQDASEEYNDASGHGRKIRFTLGDETSNSELNKGTSYVVYAFGYHNESQYTAGEPGEQLNTYFQKVGNGKKWVTDAVVEDKSGESINAFTEDFIVKNASDDHAEELFAGSASIAVDEKGNFSQGVTLHRQVAGMFTYAYNVPYFSTAKYLKVYASQESQDMVLGHFYSKVLGENGTTNNVRENVVNGTNLNAAETLIYEIDLNAWFTKIQDVNNDGIIDTYNYTNVAGELKPDTEGTANWHRPDGGKFDDVTLVKGSVFGGEFIIPFVAKTGNQTFVLRLTDESGNELRSWSVKLPSTQLIKEGTLTTWDTSDWKDETVTEDQSAHHVLRNHLYSIGKKTAEGDGGDKKDPDPDGPDNPQDLSTKQDILLQVNDNWEMIHQMEVD